MQTLSMCLLLWSIGEQQTETEAEEQTYTADSDFNCLAVRQGRECTAVRSRHTHALVDPPGRAGRHHVSHVHRRTVERQAAGIDGGAQQ